MKPLLFILVLFPVIAINAQEKRSIHLKYEDNDQKEFILYEGFVVKYNPKTKTPSYTIHRLTADQINPDNGKKTTRKNYFVTESRISRDIQGTAKDYSKSGYDKGHMVPAGDFYWNQILKDETFVFTNVSPQNPTFNRSLFRTIESRIRKKVLASGSTAYIITGTLNPVSYKKAIGNSVRIPAGIYKIIYFPDFEKMYAYLFDNTVSFYTRKIKDFSVSVDALEMLTREHFFDRIEPQLQKEIENKINSL